MYLPHCWTGVSTCIRDTWHMVMLETGMYLGLVCLCMLVCFCCLQGQRRLQCLAAHACAQC